ncbi:MAG TPA: hypothetical protein VH593_06575, partial [Ktedonobacteraceae bacterium]
GHIGSSEGVVPLLQNARRFLKAGGKMIPRRCTSLIAAVSLPQDFLQSPAFSEFAWSSVEDIFQAMGHPFDIRVRLTNVPLAHAMRNEVDR